MFERLGGASGVETGSNPNNRNGVIETGSNPNNCARTGTPVAVAQFADGVGAEGAAAPKEPLGSIKTTVLKSN